MSFKKKFYSIFIILLLIAGVNFTACGGDGGGGNTPASSTSKQILTFGFTSPASTGVIDETAKTIAVRVPFKTDVTKLAAVFSTNGEKTTVAGTEQTSGTTENNFTGSVVYIVVAQDGTKAEYTVTVTVAESDEKDITGFTIGTQSITKIDGTDITVTVPFGSNKASLTPSITHTGASINPDTGVSRNFTNPVKYTVTAADGSINEYTVTVKTWVKTFVGTGGDYGAAIGTDSSGNIYITGGFDGTVDFGGSSITSNGSTNFFITRYSPDGTLQWFKALGGSGMDNVSSLKTDSSGNIYAAGSTDGSIDFGGGTVSSGGAFIVKYDSGGSYQWVKILSSVVVYSLALDSSGNYYLTGSFSDSVDFGDGTSVAPKGGDDIFVAKYDNSGTLMWVKTYGGSAPEHTGYGLSIFIDAAGSVLVSGYFEGAVDFGDGSAASAGLSDYFVVKHASGGDYLWSKIISGPSIELEAYICADSSNNIYITGYLKGSIDFGSGSTVTGSGSSDIFIAKYSPDGEYRWANRLGGTTFDGAVAICTDSLANVYVTGHFAGTVDFGDGNVTSNGSNDFVIAKFSTDGVYRWARTLGTAGSDVGRSVCADTSGNIYVLGDFNGTLNFGDGDVEGNGAQDFFLIKILN